MWVSDWKRRFKSVDLPAWFVNLFPRKALCHADLGELSADDVKLGATDIPRLFGLCYGPYPLFYKRDQGWGFLRPAREDAAPDSLPEFVDVTLQRQETVRFPAR